MYYNYTNSLLSVTLEENLRIYKCQSTSSCDWVLLNYTAIQDQNLITANFANFSVFMLAESIATTTTTTTSSEGGAANSGGSAGKAKTTLDIIQPGEVSVYQDGKIITPFKIKNTGLGTLNGISLSAETATSGIEVSLENNYIPILLSGQEITSNLIINTNEFKDENAEIKIIAKVSSPSFQDQVKFLVKLIKGINEQESSAKEQIVFANKLFEGNPLCKELQELLTEAEKALEQKNYQEAFSLADGAINACKNLLSEKELPLRLPKKASQTELIILVIEGFVFMFITYGLYNYYKRRKLKRLNR